MLILSGTTVLLRYIKSVLEGLARHKAYKFLDGFSGYNQVKISASNQHKTTFATKWGTYAYRVMPIWA